MFYLRTRANVETRTSVSRSQRVELRTSVFGGWEGWSRFLAARLALALAMALAKALALALLPVTLKLPTDTDRRGAENDLVRSSTEGGPPASVVATFQNMHD